MSSNTGVLMKSASGADPSFYKKKREAEKRIGRELTTAEFEEDHYEPPTTSSVAGSGTSIFDPTLTELSIRWFCPPAGTILDPFAGGSVRGIISAKLGRKYIGNDLRHEQVEANRKQAADILSPDDVQPVWTVGDSLEIDNLAYGTKSDMILSCPPYADLEVYSENPADLSNMEYDKFIKVYREIISKTCAMLRNDRFAVWVVGDIRDKSGFYRGFPWHTVQAFNDAGLRLYNEAVLVTPVGSLPIRVGKQFEVSRKLGKTHQNVFVFVKGDPKEATKACGPVEFGAIDEDD